jgi:hypothetical protein
MVSSVVSVAGQLHTASYNGHQNRLTTRLELIAAVLWAGHAESSPRLHVRPQRRGDSLSLSTPRTTAIHPQRSGAGVHHCMVDGDFAREEYGIAKRENDKGNP